MPTPISLACFIDDSWEKRWVQSKHKSDYGEFKLSAGKYYGDEKRDQGLKTSQDAKFYSRAAKFPKVSLFYCCSYLNVY